MTVCLHVNWRVKSAGEYDTGMTTKESDSNIDPSHADYVQAPDQGGHKKSSLFGKLKEKTKKAGDKIKSKVGKKKSDGTGTGQDDDDDEEDDTDVSLHHMACP